MEWNNFEYSSNPENKSEIKNFLILIYLKWYKNGNAMKQPEIKMI